MGGKTTLHSLCLAVSSALLLLCLVACNGNGLAVEYDGEIYSRSASSGSSSSGSSSGSTGTWTGSGFISGGAGDILELSNSNDPDSILSLFGDGSGGTTDITLSSSSIGLPAGGYVTLTITGAGISYVADSYASSDGNVHFTIPRIAAGTTVTVSIVVKDANGTVECSGSRTKTVSDASSLVDITLTGQGTVPDDDVWTLPNPATVSASVTSMDYIPSSVPAQTVRFEVVGLSDPTSGTLHYAWTNAQNVAIGTDAKVIEVPVTDIIGVDPSTLPSGNSNLPVNLVLTYTDEDGNTQTSSASCLVQVTIYTIPTFSIEEQTPLPAGIAVHSPSGYEAVDLTRVLTVYADPASSFRTGTTFEWKVNGSVVTDSSGNPLATASVPILLSDYITGPLDETSPTSLTITCQASDSWAVNSPSPTTPVSKTLDFYKALLAKPVIGVPTCSGTYIGNSGTTYSFYTITGSGVDPFSTSVSFALTAESLATFPSGTEFNWKINGSSMWGSSASYGSSTPGTNIGAIPVTSLPGTFEVTCEATCGGVTMVSDPITVKMVRYPSSIPAFSTTFDSIGGNPIAGGVGYKVNAGHSISVKVVGSGLPANNSGATFTWKINGVEVKSGSNQEDSFTVADLTAKGIIPNASALGVWSGAGSEGNGTEITLSCTISYEGLPSMTKDSDASSGGWDVTKLFHE